MRAGMGAGGEGRTAELFPTPLILVSSTEQLLGSTGKLNLPPVVAVAVAVVVATAAATIIETNNGY